MLETKGRAVLRGCRLARMVWDAICARCASVLAVLAVLAVLVVLAALAGLAVLAMLVVCCCARNKKTRKIKHSQIKKGSGVKKKPIS